MRTKKNSVFGHFSRSEKLKHIFDRNYQYHIERELKYCVIPTKANKKIELNILKTTNETTSTHSQLRTSHFEKLTVQFTV